MNLVMKLGRGETSIEYFIANFLISENMIHFSDYIFNFSEKNANFNSNLFRVCWNLFALMPVKSKFLKAILSSVK